MSELVSCASCASHVRRGTCICPHCGGHACTPRASATPAALVLGLTLAGCALNGGRDQKTLPETGVQADYGIALTDADGDGYFAEEDDCDDEDEAVHPGATETPGDGVDSNCNDDDDT